MTTTDIRPPHVTPAATDLITRRLLDEMQNDFPLIERPYRELGARLGITEDAALAHLNEARRTGVVRQVCAIYDTKALGYSSALVAMRVAPERLDRAAAIVGAHPGVSHNYSRDHSFNLWFTVAMPPGSSLDAVVDRLHELTDAESTRLMPAVRTFKIRVTFDMAGGRSAGVREAAPASHRASAPAASAALTADDIAYIRCTQDDLPATPEPWASIAAQLGTDVPAVLDRARSLKASGHLRRFAALLNHRRAGFVANGMSVWGVPAEDVQQFGDFVAGYRDVSHCYERPTYDDWPYSVFAMIHGATRDDVEEVAAAIADETGVSDRGMLYSRQEFKKVRLRYFVSEYARWEALCEAAARRDPS